MVELTQRFTDCGSAMLLKVLWIPSVSFAATLLTQNRFAILSRE
jgi:hypothetical protein